MFFGFVFLTYFLYSIIVFGKSHWHFTAMSGPGLHRSSWAWSSKPSKTNPRSGNPTCSHPTRVQTEMLHEHSWCSRQTATTKQHLREGSGWRNSMHHKLWKQEKASGEKFLSFPLHCYLCCCQYSSYGFHFPGSRNTKAAINSEFLTPSPNTELLELSHLSFNLLHQHTWLLCPCFQESFCLHCTA